VAKHIHIYFGGGAGGKKTAKQVRDAPSFSIIESRRWKNKKTGATASIYGAVPYGNESDKKNWEIETVGFTARNERTGQVGIGRAPWKSRGEAEAWLAEMKRKGLAADAAEPNPYKIREVSSTYEKGVMLVKCANGKKYLVKASEVGGVAPKPGQILDPSKHTEK